MNSIFCLNLITQVISFLCVHVVHLTLLGLCLGSSDSQLSLSHPTYCPHINRLAEWEHKPLFNPPPAPNTLTHTNTDTQSHSHTVTQTHRHTDTDTHTHIHIHTHTRLSRTSWHWWGTAVVCVWRRSHGNGISSLPGYEEQTDHLGPSRGPAEIDLFILIISGLSVIYDRWLIISHPSNGKLGPLFFV